MASSWSHHERLTFVSAVAQPYSRLARCQCTRRERWADSFALPTIPSMTSPSDLLQMGGAAPGIPGGSGGFDALDFFADFCGGLGSGGSSPSCRAISSSGSSCATSHEAKAGSVLSAHVHSSGSAAAFALPYRLHLPQASHASHVLRGRSGAAPLGAT